MNGVAMPEMVSYFTSRGSLMGQVPGEFVAAAFAVFNPLVVVPAVTTGWSVTGILAGWSRAVQAAHGYPQSGPHELAEAARRR